MFRSFDDVDPAAVRVVIVGQDPYPRVERATGRAFEDGALTDWTGGVAISLQHLMQSALALRLGRSELFTGAGGWATIRRDIARQELRLAPLGAYFDGLQGAGVLFVNAGWTLTRFVSGGGPEQKAHIALWRPLMRRLLTGLCDRGGTPVVFLLLGGFAQNLFTASGARAEAIRRGVWDTRVRAIAHAHPNATAYFNSNPFAAVNDALSAMGADEIAW